MILGIDPSQRNTGLCVLRSAGPKFFEIRTEKLDVLSSIRRIKKQLGNLLNRLPQSTVICMEKQISLGGQMSPLMYAVQLAVVEAIGDWNPNPTFVAPLPVQLQSYVKRKHHPHINPKSATEVVEAFKAKTGFKGRISVHKVDAYYLALAAQEVLAGTWSYNAPKKDAAIWPWPTIYGST